MLISRDSRVVSSLFFRQIPQQNQDAFPTNVNLSRHPNAQHVPLGSNSNSPPFGAIAAPKATCTQSVKDHTKPGAPTVRFLGRAFRQAKTSEMLIKKFEPTKRHVFQGNTGVTEK